MVHIAKCGLLSLLLFVALFSGCTEDGVQPEDVVQPTNTTSHDFVWEMDTVFAEKQSYISAIWGSDRNNVWMACHRNPMNDAICKWDGTEWVWQDKYMSVVCVDGLDSSYVLFGGYNQSGVPEILAYNRGEWETISLPQKVQKVSLLAIAERNVFYVGGYHGILKYDTGTWLWLIDSTGTYEMGSPLFDPLDMICINGSLRYVSIMYYSDRINGTMAALWKWDHDSYAVVDSFVFNMDYAYDMHFGYMFHATDSSVFSTSLGGVYELQGDAWKRIYDVKSYGVTGKRNNLYSKMISGIAHYNGVSWVDITPYRLMMKPGVRNILYVDGELFFDTRIDDYSIMLRGVQQ